MHTPHTQHKEPEEVFLPLSPSRYAEFYSLEMDKHTSDICFYLNNSAEYSKVLELGCGTGRISRELSKTCRNVTGLDLSHEMLQLATSHDTNGTDYICMDMCQMAFTTQFDRSPTLTVKLPTRTSASGSAMETNLGFDSTLRTAVFSSITCSRDLSIS